MNYMQIRPYDIANGPGVRVTLFVSGCKLNCKGCFNKEAQCFFAGQPFTQETIDYILELCDKDEIQGLTLLGGDPLEPDNQLEILNLLTQFRNKFQDTKDIWCWTGRIFDIELQPNGKYYVDGVTNEVLKHIDIIVDGRFVQRLMKKGLIYMGSTNQKIIDVKETLKQGKTVLSQYDSVERR